MDRIGVFEKDDSIKYGFKRYLEITSDEKVKIYIEDRVLSQIDWYNIKSISNKRKYILLTIVSVSMSTVIPILTLYLSVYDDILIKMCIAIFSSIITAISSILALSKYKELWVQYRENCEIVKSFLYSFFTRQGQFNNLNDTESFDRLVEICEHQFLIEFNKWDSAIKQHDGNEMYFVKNKDVEESCFPE